ncbi:MAG: SUMF1/EgtB/PvdO family nonheme iron enzyme [Polyangiales bacterium]
MRAATALAIVALGVLLLARVHARAPTQTPTPLGTPRKCARYDGLPEGFGVRPHVGMVEVPAGTLVPGSTHGYPEERGDGEAVHVDAFLMDRHEVTNAQFAAFVRATGHVTEAERAGGAAVFDGSRHPSGALTWWRWVAGASWRHPRGPGSDLRDKQSHPVVQVAHADALAYAAWLGHALPSEHEWEHAAKARIDDAALDAAPRDAAGKPTANFWQGAFPERDEAEDGYAGTAPVGCFAPSALGLHDLLGNVWEWTRDRYTPTRRAEDRIDGDAGAHCAPGEHGAEQGALKRVVKGGSFLCAPSSCARYRASARHPQEAQQAAQHLGFRTILRHLGSESLSPRRPPYRLHR